MTPRDPRKLRRAHMRATTIAFCALALVCLTSGVAQAADATGPVDVTIDVPSTTTNDSSVAVTGDKGTDPESGVAAWRIERQKAPLAGDACGIWSPWAPIGPANPTDPVSDGLVDATCFKYQFVSANGDGVESAAPQAGELKVDRSAPVVGIDTPTVPIRGTVMLSGSAADAVTRIASVSVLVEDQYSICPSAALVAGGRWTCEWKINEYEVGPVNLVATAIDVAGNRSSSAVAVTIVKPPSPFGPRPEDVDVQAPVVGLARMPLVSWSNVVTVKASAYDDRPGTLDLGVEHRRASAATLRFTSWRTSYEETTRVVLRRRGETNCWRGIAADPAGNRSVSDPRCTTLPLDDIDLRPTRGSSWRSARVKGAYRNAVRRSTKRGSALTVRVADPTPTLVVTACRGCGTIRVYHGRRIVGTYSLNARRTTNRRLIKLRRLARPTSQQLRVVALTSRPVLVDGVIADLR